MIGRQTDAGSAEKGADAEVDAAHAEASDEGAAAEAAGGDEACGAGGIVEMSLGSIEGSVLTPGVDEKDGVRGAVVNGLVCAAEELESFGIDVRAGGRAPPLMSPLTLRLSAGSKGAGFSFFLPLPSLPPVLDDAA
jgi:hypothetical protein